MRRGCSRSRLLVRYWIPLQAVPVLPAAAAVVVAWSASCERLLTVTARRHPRSGRLSDVNLVRDGDGADGDRPPESRTGNRMLKAGDADRVTWRGRGSDDAPRRQSLLLLDGKSLPPWMAGRTVQEMLRGENGCDRTDPAGGRTGQRRAIPKSETQAGDENAVAPVHVGDG